MRRLLRIVFNALAVLSLVLAVGVAGLWLRGYWVDDLIVYSRPDWSLIMESGGGRFRLESTTAGALSQFVRAPNGFTYMADRSDGPVELGQRMPGSREHFKRLGFWIVSGERWGDDHYAAFVPAWFVEGLVLAFASSFAVRYFRGKPKSANHCPTCRYDLRATPDRCPECGVVPTR